MSDREKHSGTDGKAEAQEARIQAYLDGTLDAAELAAFEAMLAEDPGLAREVRSYKAIAGALFATGESFKAETPGIDVLDEVMGQLPKAEAHPPENVVPFLGTDKIDAQIEAELESMGRDFAAGALQMDMAKEILEKVRALEASVQARRDNIVPLKARPLSPPPKQAVRTGISRKVFGALAVAAGLLLVFAIANREFLQNQYDTVQQFASGQQKATGGMPAPSGDATDTPGETEEVAVPKPALSLAQILPDLKEQGDPGQNIYASISLEMAMENKRNATLETEEGIRALAELKTWATLTPEQAQRLLEQGGLSREAMLGIAQFLPPEEAAALLEAQAALDPENPYLHFSLAAIKAGLGDAQNAITHLAELERHDPGNAINPFLMAAVQRDQGNDEMALALLLESAASPTASTYALEAANYRADALIAQGYDPAVARYLAALNAGTSEYSQVLELANGFVEYGQAFELGEDYATAMQLYQSLNQFGVNMTHNAAFSNERLAGLDTQNAALTAIQGIVNLFQDPVNVQVLASGLEVFNAGLREMHTFFGTFNSLIETADPTGIAQYSEEILRFGDLGFVENQLENGL